MRARSLFLPYVLFVCLNSIPIWDALHIGIISVFWKVVLALCAAGVVELVRLSFFNHRSESIWYVERIGLGSLMLVLSKCWGYHIYILQVCRLQPLMSWWVLCNSRVAYGWIHFILLFLNLGCFRWYLSVVQNFIAGYDKPYRRTRTFGHDGMLWLSTCLMSSALRTYLINKLNHLVFFWEKYDLA